MILAAAAERPVLDAIIKTKTEAEQRLREAGFEEVDTAACLSLAKGVSAMSKPGVSRRALLKLTARCAQVGFDTHFLREFNALRYIRQLKSPAW